MRMLFKSCIVWDPHNELALARMLPTCQSIAPIFNHSDHMLNILNYPGPATMIICQFRDHDSSRGLFHFSRLLVDDETQMGASPSSSKLSTRPFMRNLAKNCTNFCSHYKKREDDIRHLRSNQSGCPYHIFCSGSKLAMASLAIRCHYLGLC